MQQSAAPLARTRSAARAERLYHRLLGAALAAPWVVVAASRHLRRRRGRHLHAASRAADAGRGPRRHPDLGQRAAGRRRRAIMDTQMRQVEAAVAPLVESGEVTNMFLNAGQQSRNSGFVVLTLAPWEERERSAAGDHRGAQSEAAEDSRRAGLACARRTASASAAAGRACASPSPAPTTTRSPTRRTKLQQALEETADLRHGHARTTTPRSRSSPIQIDREAASDLGVSVETLGTTLAHAPRRHARWANTTSTATRSRSARRRRTA